MVWYPYSQLHINHFHDCVLLFHKEWCITRAARPTLFPQSNAQPHYTLKSMRLAYNNQRPVEELALLLLALLRYCNEIPKKILRQG